MQLYRGTAFSGSGQYLFVDTITKELGIDSKSVELVLARPEQMARS